MGVICSFHDYFGLFSIILDYSRSFSIIFGWFLDYSRSWSRLFSIINGWFFRYFNGFQLFFDYFGFNVLCCLIFFLIATITIRSNFRNDIHEPVNGTIYLAKFILFESFSFETNQRLASLVLLCSFCVYCVLDLLLYFCIWARKKI